VNIIEAAQTSGFITVNGHSDLTYGVSGVGSLDISQANQGNPAISQGKHVYVGGNTINVYRGNYVTFRPYYKLDYWLATSNSSNSTEDLGGPAPFDGLLETRTITDFGNFTVTFPPNVTDTSSNPAPFNNQRTPNSISIPKTNIMYSSTDTGGMIGIASYITFGLEVEMGWQPNFGSRSYATEIIDVSSPFLAGTRRLL